MWKEYTRAHSALCLLKKRKKWLVFVYLRLLKISAVAIATAIIIAAPMATYVDVGTPLAGGTITALGDGEAVGA